MFSTKKLALQLTPLLDLLLIVIFAQFMEMEQQEETRARQQGIEQSRMLYEVDQLKEELEFTKSVLEQIQQDRTKAESLASSLEKKNDAQKQQAKLNQQEFQRKLKELNAQRNRIIAAIRDIFSDSSTELKELLKKMAASAATPSAIPQEQIEQLARKLADSEAVELATFLMAYEEIRKRCDVWEIHLDQKGIANLLINENRFQIRITSQEDFQRRLFEIYKSLPQAKGLVIILVSYDDVARALRETLLLSLPETTERMRKDADGRTRFEYAVIGYLPREKMPLRTPKTGGK